MSHLSPITQVQPTSIYTVAVGYLRVSTKHQVDGVGLEAQLAAIDAYARACGIVLEVILQEHHTATDSTPLEERPQFRKAAGLARAMNCPIIVARMDRVSRNPVTFRDFCRSAGIQIIAACEEDSSRPETQAAIVAEGTAKVSHQHARQAQVFGEMKAAGKKLGNPSPSPKAHKQSRKVRQGFRDQRIEKIAAVLREIGRNVTRKVLAEELNARDILTGQGKEWTVKRLQRDHKAALERIKTSVPAEPQQKVMISDVDEELKENPMFGMF